MSRRAWSSSSSARCPRWRTARKAAPPSMTLSRPKARSARLPVRAASQRASPPSPKTWRKVRPRSQYIRRREAATSGALTDPAGVRAAGWDMKEAFYAGGHAAPAPEYNLPHGGFEHGNAGTSPDLARGSRRSPRGRVLLDRRRVRPPPRAALRGARGLAAADLDAGDRRGRPRLPRVPDARGRADVAPIRDHLRVGRRAGAASRPRIVASLAPRGRMRVRPRASRALVGFRGTRVRASPSRNRASRRRFFLERHAIFHFPGRDRPARRGRRVRGPGTGTDPDPAGGPHAGADPRAARGAAVDHAAPDGFERHVLQPRDRRDRQLPRLRRPQPRRRPAEPAARGVGDLAPGRRRSVRPRRLLPLLLERRRR